MISQPVVFELVYMGVETENHPDRTTTQARADAAELSFPNIEAAEGVGNDLAFALPSLAVSAQIVEVVFVENDRAGTQEVLALQFVVDEGRRVFVCQGFGKLLFHHGQRFDRATVVVFPM